MNPLTREGESGSINTHVQWGAGRTADLEPFQRFIRLTSKLLKQLGPIEAHSNTSMN